MKREGITTMRDVMLLDYRDEDIAYLFHSDTGSLIACEQGASNGLHAAGYALHKRIGVVRFRVITVAVFCDGPRITLWIPGTEVDLCSDAVCGKIRLAAPFIREFRLTQGERVLYSCAYWHSGARVWPDDGDIFSYIGRITASPEALARAHCMWTARVAGQPFTDFDT